MLMSIYDFKDYVKKLPKVEQVAQLESAQVVVKVAERKKCEHCQQLRMFEWSRLRKYCNNACKQKAYRARKNAEVKK